MNESTNKDKGRSDFVGTIVGESTTQEFRMAVHAAAVSEQDIVAVDADMAAADESTERPVRVWAKVRKIERLNPLFPSEAGHELAETRTDPFDTVLSFSREMVTAVCQIIGHEPRGSKGGKLDNLRYPPKPASTVYHPETKDLSRIVLGDLSAQADRGLDLATLSSRNDIAIQVDGHAVVTRHLAILAMTGAGKSWTARRIVEQLATKNYPMIIFDPRGDYTRLGEVPELRGKVNRYYADFPVFEEDVDVVANMVSALVGYELSEAQTAIFPDIFKGARRLIGENAQENAEKIANILEDNGVTRFGLKADMFAIYWMARVAAHIVRNDSNEDKEWVKKFFTISGDRRQAGTLDVIARKARQAAYALRTMSDTNRQQMTGDDVLSLPSGSDRKELAQYGKISVISLGGYTGDFQAALFSIVAQDLFNMRVRGQLGYPALFVLEEAHNFAPAKAMSAAEKRAINVTRQIAQEGRKFGLGLILISQRPSRLDETALSQCNSQIIMRLINPADQNFVRRTVEALNEDDMRMLPALDVGEAIFSGQMINFTVLARIKEPKSKGEREEEDAFEALKKAHKKAQGGR